MKVIFVILFLFLDNFNAESDPIYTCNKTGLQECLLDFVHAAFDGYRSENCSSPFQQSSCVAEHLKNCRNHLGTTLSPVFTTYIELLDRIQEKSCKNPAEIQSCDLSDAKSCIADFMVVMTSGHLGSVCRQTSIVLNCLSPTLERCSGLPRYLVALVTDEIQLTTDFWCSSRACRLDVASQCIDDAMEIFDYPSAIEMQSNLICRDLKSSLACAINNTELCPSNSIPVALSIASIQMSQFSSAYCGINPVTMTSSVPRDLVAPLYLAALTTNDWTSEKDICKIYNATIKLVASERISFGRDVESLLTWQQYLSISFDKLSDTCFNNGTLDCDWITVLANESPTCDPVKANQCVDIVLLSKLTVEVNLMRMSWESTCSVAYNMIACVQYHTGSCVTADLSSVIKQTQEIENLVGYECSQLGADDTQGDCDIENHTCESARAVHECTMLGYGLEDRCREKDKIYSCFQEHMGHCDSAQRVPAQFYMEWLLNTCSHNFTLLADDIYTGVSRCKLQYGYNLYNGILGYSAFNTMVCSVTTLYRQCLADQFIPSVVVMYMQEVEEFYSTMQLTACNVTRPGSDLSTVSEVEDCLLSETASEVTLSLEFYSNFPFMSLEDQEVVCRTYPSFKDIWASRALSCSTNRQSVISDATTYFDNIHNALCSVSRPDVQRSCDVTKVQTCLEDFGAFTYFAKENSNICGKVEETFGCLSENTKGCDDVTHDALLQEVMSVHSLLGNTTCQKPKWCATDNSTDWFPWQREICSDWDQCLLFDWMSCVDQYNLYSCQFYTEGVACIEEKLSSCNPMQILLAMSEMEQWIQQNSPNCYFVPNDPPSVTPVYKNMFECSYYISKTQDVSKQGLCSAIDTYLACLTSTDPSDVPYVWRGILGRNGQMWRKRLYFDCQVSSASTFIVGQDFNPDNITGGACTFDSQFCLRAFTSLAVTYFHLMPLSDRFQSICERSNLQYECVMSQASGCFDRVDRYLLTSAEWIREGFDNAGTCSNDNDIRRECNPDAAMECVADLGYVLINDLESVLVDTVCSKHQSTAMCVNLQTSSCDYFTRSQVAKTFNQISAIVKSVCSPSPIMPVTTSCLREGEATQCDLEEFLMCIVPVQAMLLHPNSTWEQICRPIPEMKTCIHRSTSGCDEVTMRSVYQRLHRLSHRLNDQCPQFYCEECMARSCLVSMQRNLQYQNASLCGVISETKQCLYQHAGYCDLTVRDNLLKEMTLLAGQDAFLCEITLPSCLQTFMMSALQISGYTPLMNVSAQNDYLLGQLCYEANTAYYCVSQHLTSVESKKLQVINSTLEKIGNIVYGKCQGSQLQCYSCVNATSNEECNQRTAQTCSTDMQMCGTVFTGTALYKGCVKPELCQSGCNGTMCSMCCGTSLCNQPWNNVIIEPVTCQPEAAMYCGFQLLASLVQNETVNCVNLQASLTCMIQSTQSCMSSQSMSLGILARDLLSRDIMTSCIEKSPVCGCGQCTSMLLLSVVSSPYGDVDKFCRTVFDMYNRTLLEMDLTNCSMSDIQTTAYNLQLTVYMIQGICSIQDISNTNCNYNGMMYSHGASFMAEDGCNYCSCDRGAVACTLMYCPPDDRSQCPDIDPDQVGICVEMCFKDYDCNNGQLCCSNGCGHVCTQPKPQGAGSCNYENKTYSTGDSFIATDRCNFCFCYAEIVSCTEMYCPSGGGSCHYNGILYQDGDTFPAEDGCNRCTCNNGNVACTYMSCPTDNKNCPVVDPNHAGTCVELCSADSDCADGQLCCSNGCGHVCTNYESEGRDECNYDGTTYRTGESFTASDGCNTCFCTNGLVGCTRMYCPTEGTCDIQGVQTCINDAALPYLMLRASTVNARHICMSAAGLLKCVESKVNQCPSQILDIIHSAVWSNLNRVQSVCDINNIIWLYTYHGGHANYTVPATSGTCSLQKGVGCFSVFDDYDTCSSYQSMIDCVHNFTSDCLTIDVVPVLFELKAHVEGKLSDCDLVIPRQNMDPFYPIANCMTEFGASVNSELTLTYLRHGRLNGVCDKISVLIGCLHNISNVQPAGKLFVSNLVASLANLVRLCNDWGDDSPQELVTCHHCQGFADMESCDSMPVYECQQKQVCATALQLDPNSGVPMVTKGCADLAWCQISHGCNPYFMSCVTCCHGDRCNSADNMTTNITLTTDSWRTTTMKQTRNWRTTSLPQTWTTNSYDSCHIDRISAVLTAHVLRLMTFNNLPAYDRQFICKNDFEEFGSVTDYLDSNCPEDVDAHVRKLMDWLREWKVDVCDENTVDDRCIEAVQCVSDVGNFTNKNSACRSISKALDCLQTYYSYCNSQGQMSINSTRQILSDMNYVICEPNKLFGGPEDIDCVSIETTDVTSARCDVNMTIECAAHIEKAYVNPFMTQDDFCRVGKRGLVCIRDNSYNCSMETITALSPKTMQLIQAISQSCPDALCPAEEKCNLEPAWQCLRSLESEFSQKLNNGSFNRSVCTSIARTHHCVLNATQNCNIASTQRLFHQFSVITLLAEPWCNEQPTSFHMCLNNLHQGVDSLMNSTEKFIAQILESRLRNLLLHHLLYKEFDDMDTAKGMALLGLDISLFTYFNNETLVNLPAVLGYMFKNSNNLDEINLPALSQFLSQLTSALPQRSDGDDGAGGDGLNLPGGSSSGGQDSKTCNEFTDINLPGDYLNPSDNGGFGYGLNLPGGYGSLTSIDIEKYIEQIIAILFQSNANTASEVTDKILDVLDIKLMDVPYMIDERSLIEYNHYKSHLCNGIQHSVDCAYGTLHNILMTSSKKQEFLSTSSLRLLHEHSYDMCQEIRCYSCNELHSNEECNAQPLARCGPLQVCQTKFTGIHFYKGCVSTLTCQQECQEGEGQCYCCEGNQCNQDAVSLSDDTKCRIQTAVDAAFELLAYSTSESYMEDGALLRKTATDMINSTKSCHGKFQKNFRNEGERITLLFEAETCAKSFISKKCNIEELHLLTHIVSASFSTVASVEAVCSLYHDVLHEVTLAIAVGGCCDRDSVETLIDIFHLVHPICKEANIEKLCKIDVHPSCSDLLPESTNSSRIDSKNSTYEDEDRSLTHMCSRFMYHINGEANRSRTSETEIQVECKVTDALNECFGDIGDPIDCSDTAFDEMLLCVQNRTYGCLPMQSLPVMFVLDRFYHHCGKDINSTLSDSEEDRESYQCIKELATVNISVEVESTLVASLCDAVGSANDCLNAKQVRHNSLQSLFFDGVQNKMNRFTSVICADDSKKELDKIKANNTCETERLEITLHYLNFVITSPFALMNGICRYTSELEKLDRNITACSDSISSITTWIHNEVTEMCDANMAANLCHQSTCDVPMATDLLEQLGYFLLANGFDDFVFCQKIANVLHGVKCVTHDCEEDLSSVTAEIMYIKSVVGSRCPQLTDELFCADRIVDHARNTSIGNEMRNLNAKNNNKNSNKNNNDNNNVNATERNRESEICDIMASKLCVYSVTFPSSEDGLYCSKMVHIVSKLSDCVTENLIGCDYNDLRNTAMYYRNLFLKRGPVCYVDFTTSLFAQLIEADQCAVPQCSHEMAYGCFSHFKYEKGKRCGNFEDVKQCVNYATEGCNEMQQYVLMSSLDILAEIQNVPRECWLGVKLPLNDSLASLTDCLSDFNHHVSEVQQGHVTGSSTCRMMQSLLACIESTLELADMPSLMKVSAKHIVYVTKPSVETFCKDTATVNMSKAETVDEEKVESIESNETCDIRQAQFCMKISTLNVLLSPTFSSEGKEFVCDHLPEWRSCLHKTLSDCSDGGITRPYSSIYSLIEIIAQLSGACSPEPVTCSPEIAMECVSSLGHAISQRPLQQDTCWALQRTKLCIRQTMLGCDNFSWQAFQRTYVPFSCKAHALCPAALSILDYTTDTPQPCIDLKEVVVHSGTCSPSTALRCLQDFYLDALDPNKVTRNAACGKYPAALTCFFNNINACDDDMIVLLAMFYLPSINDGMDSHCETKLEHNCPTDGEHGCDLKQMEECIAAFKNVANSGHLQEQCLGYETAKHCFEMSTMICPRITRLYAKAKFMVSTSTWVDNHEYLCDNIHQCTYNYMMYFKSLISNINDHFGNSDGNTRIRRTKELKSDPTILYQCRRRLEELSCIQIHLKMLPEDIAMLINELLLQRDGTFTDICAMQTGLLLEIEGCNQTCMQCLLNMTGNQSDLALLLSFVADTVNDSAEQLMFSSSRFCRTISQLQMSGDGLNVSCFADPESQRWQTKHMNYAANLFDKYCARPCNETQAAYCIEQFRSDVLTLNKEEICLSFNETLKCLEDGVTSCEANITSQYVNEAERIFTDTDIVCYTMPTFEVSYNASEMVVVEGGISQQGSISVIMTTPVMSSCYGNSCYMELFISMEQPTTVCSSGSEIQQILMDSCAFIFDASNTDETHEFNFYPRVDHKMEPSTNVTVNVIGQLWEDGLLATGATLASVTLMLEDRDTPGVCYLISEPTIRTFDSLLYYSFHQGEYILYQHDTIPERVHVGFQACRSGSDIPCPCVIMVLSGDDTFILDRCRRFGERNHALEFTYFKNNDLTEKTKVYTITNRDFFQFVLPSGTIVNVRSGRFLLDAWIKPSALDFGHTSGLCGTYDGDMENDLTMSDNAVEPLDEVFRWKGNLLPVIFVKSWRPGNTLFGGVPESNNPLPSDILGQKCMCVNSTCVPMDIVETCDFIIGEDITAELDLYTQIIENENRRKRQTEDIWNTIDFNPEDPTDQFPTWPTDSGFTEAIATQICETALRNQASWDICNVAIDTSSIISSCVTEILLTDTDEFVNDYVEDMKVQCKLAVLADPSIASLLNQTQEKLVSFLLTLTCLNDCNNHGQCVNDICQCDTGYNGDDCSGSADSAPVITSLSEYIYSGTTDSGLSVITRQITVYGSGFENSASLTCHLEQAQVSNNGYISSGVISSSAGTFLTSESIRCDMTGSLPLTGVLVSVSNNGVNTSNDVLYIFQDEVCYDCDPALQICNLQPTSCMIDGQCFRAGTYNPTDQCLVCDPVTNVWTFKPSSSCTTTSKSTRVSTTTSTSSSSPSSSFVSSTLTSVSTSRKTSSSPLSSSSTSSTTSSKSTNPTQSKTSSASTPAQTSSTLSGQGGETSDQDIFNIVIITGACVGVLIIIVTVIFACRLRRSDKRVSETGSSTNSPESPKKKGQSNPGYSRGEPRQIAGDPVIQPRRVTEVYSANFNTEGLEGRSGAPAMYRDDPGLQTVNIDFFDEDRDRGARTNMPTRSRPVNDDAVYDNARLERQYTIPRPHVDPSPAGLYPEVRRQTIDAEYDNATGLTQRPDNDRRDPPMPDYYEDDGSYTITKM